MNERLVDIHPDACLGPGVKVGNFTTIEPDVIIGEGTVIGPYVTILSGSRIGKYCQIFPGAVIGSVAQTRKPAEHSSYLKIGDYTVIREFATLNKGTLRHTMIGAHVLLMAYVHVAHDCIIEDHVTVSNAVQLAGHVEVQQHAVIGGMAAIHQFMRLGAYSMIGSKSIVRKDVPPFVRVAREPLRYCGLNLVGLKRHAFTPEQINRIQNSYNLLYQSKLCVTDALAEIDAQMEKTEEVAQISSFIRHSNRGIVKKYTP